jgi:peptidoglycan/LPS O-acetylase OafA/YrhL
MKYLVQLSEGRDNNFNLLRFIAATMVIWSHSFPLALGPGDNEPLRSSLGVTLGSIAVDIFFVSSGYLIAASLVSSKNIFRFAWARFLRIYPGLIVATVVTVVFIGLFISTEDTSRYFLDRATWKFLIKNSALLLGIEYSLPGAFTQTPAAYAVNGSLWTLPKELLMYAIFAAIWLVAGVLCQLFACNRKLVFKVIVSVTLAAALLLYVFGLKEFIEDSNIRLLTVFSFGAFISLFRDRLPAHPGLAVLLAAAILVSSVDRTFFFFVYTLLFPYLVICCALLPIWRLNEFNRLGDYSYGLYVYAFPVQQIIMTFFKGIQPEPLFGLAFLVTLVLAVISWHVIEKPALSLKGMKFGRGVVPENPKDALPTPNQT